MDVIFMYITIEFDAYIYEYKPYIHDYNFVYIKVHLPTEKEGEELSTQFTHFRKRTRQKVTACVYIPYNSTTCLICT